ncbi:eukaryotic aspartyl protease [Ancylostoma ceylanicum]|uniref:Eukaryotic aspartyl protease n=1 Tax=Ancylostoma ceylanicum TaxID=53326 RepID=A0A0D6LS78_9BILA|nr:eukaryotic aspartyl protease [Ancylostoma ceylanicum]
MGRESSTKKENDAREYINGPVPPFAKCEHIYRAALQFCLSYCIPAEEAFLSHVMYGIESVRGFCGNDTVRLGVDSERLIVPGTRFGQANKLSVFFSEKPVDGVLGLAFYLLSATNNVPPFQRAAELGLVDPIFTVYLEKVQQLDGKAHGGLVTYGGFDSQHCSETITYENLTAATYWQFKMKSVTAGDFHAAFPWKAITSTSTSFINAPVIMAEKVAKAVGAVVTMIVKERWIDTGNKL